MNRGSIALDDLLNNKFTLLDVVNQYCIEHEGEAFNLKITIVDYSNISKFKKSKIRRLLYDISEIPSAFNLIITEGKDSYYITNNRVGYNKAFYASMRVTEIYSKTYYIGLYSLADDFANKLLTEHVDVLKKITDTRVLGDGRSDLNHSEIIKIGISGIRTRYAIDDDWRTENDIKYSDYGMANLKGLVQVYGMSIAIAKLFCNGKYLKKGCFSQDGDTIVFDLMTKDEPEEPKELKEW